MEKDEEGSNREVDIEFHVIIFRSCPLSAVVGFFQARFRRPPFLRPTFYDTVYIVDLEGCPVKS